MEIEVDDIALNYLTAEGRIEITVRTSDGRTIIFPSAQVDVRTTVCEGKEKNTLYAYARKEESNPSPQVYVLLLEDNEKDGISRHRLESYPL
jgi:hypothetical protein